MSGLDWFQNELDRRAEKLPGIAGPYKPYIYTDAIGGQRAKATLSHTKHDPA